MDKDAAIAESKREATKWWVPFGLAFFALFVLYGLAFVILSALLGKSLESF